MNINEQRQQELEQEGMVYWGNVDKDYAKRNKHLLPPNMYLSIPKANSNYSVKELMSFGLLGIYSTVFPFPDMSKFWEEKSNHCYLKDNGFNIPEEVIRAFLDKLKCLSKNET